MVAGAGRSGILVSRMLAERGVDVTLVERLPAPGGQEPEPDTVGLAGSASRAGVRMMLGTLAAEFREGFVHTLGVKGAAALPAEAIVVATGSRPWTRAELGIAGERGAGILPGSVTHHLLESGVLPGRHPLVIGDGRLAEKLCADLDHAGAVTVTSVRAGTKLADRWPGTITYTGAQVLSVHGFPRVNRAVVAQGDRLTQVHSDAVILAAGRLAMRNIEGAVFASPRVIECFDLAQPKSHAGAELAARRACEQVMVALRRWPRTPDQETTCKCFPPLASFEL